jgi:lipoate-protein ligase A
MSAERWRLIATFGAPPWFNMGLDEALLLSPQAPPTLRFYSWSPDTLSLGYFQKLADVPGSARAGALCRRITGGGAIHHVNELTFSLVTALDDPLYRGPIGDSYTRVHAAFARALSDYGISAAPRGVSTLASDRAETGMCFHHSTPLDLAWDGRKGLGSAQRRKAGRVLHHGSLKLGTSALELEIATIREHRRGLQLGELAPVVEAALGRELGLCFERDVPTEREREGAHTLGPRYVDPAFVARR